VKIENMEARILNIDHLGELIELYKHLNTDDPAIDEVRLKDVWAQTTKNNNIKYIGIFLENRLVSACQMVVIPNFTRGGLSYCLIENVVTHPDHQNQGFGKALLKHTVELAWKHECYKVMLMSGRKEESVLQFYKSAGFSADEKTAFIVRAECT